VVKLECVELWNRRTSFFLFHFFLVCMKDFESVFFQANQLWEFSYFERFRV
jgi:hypothetical protein